MFINLIAMGTRLPTWINQGVDYYLKQFPKQFIQLTEIPVIKRRYHANLSHIALKETETLFAAARVHDKIILLDRIGREMDSQMLTQQLEQYQIHGERISCLIGGPEGIHETYRHQADAAWSLSKLTLPHALARLLFIEQIYRAFSMMQKHPYHR